MYFRMKSSDKYMADNKDLPVRKTMCGTCPFKEGSKYSYLRGDLTERSIHESRICHSTGSGNVINDETGFEEHICRGSRDIQLTFFESIGVIDKATDKAWNDQREKIGYKPQVIQDPVRRIV